MQQESPNWFTRVYMMIGGQYVRTRSTKTTNKPEATKIAEDFYLDCRLAARGDTPLPAQLRQDQDASENKYGQHERGERAAKIQPALIQRLVKQIADGCTEPPSQDEGRAEQVNAAFVRECAVSLDA